MNAVEQATINKLYNQFHDTFKVMGNQQEAFNKVTEGYLASTKRMLRSELFVKGYTEIYKLELA